MMRGMFRRKLKDFAEQQESESKITTIDRLKMTEIDDEEEFLISEAGKMKLKSRHPKIGRA